MPPKFQSAATVGLLSSHYQGGASTQPLHEGERSSSSGSSKSLAVEGGGGAVLRPTPMYAPMGGGLNRSFDVSANNVGSSACLLGLSMHSQPHVDGCLRTNQPHLHFPTT